MIHEKSHFDQINIQKCCTGNSHCVYLAISLITGKVTFPLPCATMSTQQYNTIPKIPPIAYWKKPMQVVKYTAFICSMISIIPETFYDQHICKKLNGLKMYQIKLTLLSHRTVQCPRMVYYEIHCIAAFSAAWNTTCIYKMKCVTSDTHNNLHIHNKVKLTATLQYTHMTPHQC